MADKVKRKSRKRKTEDEEDSVKQVDTKLVLNAQEPAISMIESTYVGKLKVSLNWDMVITYYPDVYFQLVSNFEYD